LLLLQKCISNNKNILVDNTSFDDGSVYNLTPFYLSYVFVLFVVFFPLYVGRFFISITNGFICIFFLFEEGLKYELLLFKSVDEPFIIE